MLEHPLVVVPETVVNENNLNENTSNEFEEETKIEAKALYNAQFLEQFYEANVNVIQLIL